MFEQISHIDMKCFRSHLRNSQYSSIDFIIISIGINFLLYSSTIVGLRKRLSVYPTMLRSAEGQKNDTYAWNTILVNLLQQCLKHTYRSNKNFLAFCFCSNSTTRCRYIICVFCIFFCTTPIPSSTEGIST